MKSRMVAVIEIGSTGIRLLVAEIFPGSRAFGNGRDASSQKITETEREGWREVDRAGKPVALGWDVFTTGEISRESFLACLSVLQNFRELLEGWEIAPEHIHVIATSALRVARNRDIFADRVKQETGFPLLIVEGVEENRLMYLAVRFALKQDLPIFWRANSIIIEVGGGSTELMLLRRGKMVAAHSLRLGTIMIDRQFHRNPGMGYSQGRFMRENLRNTIGFLKTEMDFSHVRTFVALGSEARIASTLIGTELNEYSRIINRDDFIAFAEKVENYGIEECVQRFHISYEETEGFVSGMLVYKLLLEQTHGAKVAVPLVSIREGFLLDLAMGVESELREEFYSQIIAGAVNLGRRYHFDEAHNLQVAKFCMRLFDALIREHGMNRRERMMLETAATLHDIGTYIKSSGHHLHSQYIVANSEIFGLRREELAIIANVVRYHRGPPPQDGDIDYIALQREERILVLKMASILRVADALDRGHSQNIRGFTVEKRGENLVLQLQGVHDISLELIGLEEKAGMFQDVFGYKVVLN
jgi:exopolyphosphatase/guanosine-5'-triphosphate,3'-diphosphate pyrophosphatase